MPEDIMQQMLQMQSMINASMQGKGGNHILGVLPAEWNASNLSLPQGGLLGKMMPTALAPSRKKRSLDGLLASVMEDFKKMNQNGKIIYDGAVTNGPPTSGLDGGGGSFASMVGGSRGGSTEIG